MLGFLRRVSRFLATMDAKTATSLAVSGAMLAFVAVMLVFGRDWLNLDADGRLAGLFRDAAGSPLAIVGVIAIFSALALTGFPQFILIGGAVMWFGPWQGALFAWIGTMASAILTFAIGRLSGGDWLRRIGGARADALVEFLRRHGVAASGLIRVVPTAPFIVVNAAAGVAGIPLWKYLLGSGVGIVPKISLVAALAAIAPDEAAVAGGLSGVLGHFAEGGEGRFITLASLVAGWIVFLIAVRILYLGLRAR